jgi:hypothetical protein
MNMDLIATGDPDMPHMCYDVFAGSDTPMDDWVGAAWAEDTEVGFAFLNRLADRLQHPDCWVVPVDNGGSCTLLVHADAWRDPVLQNTWKEVLGATKEQLVEHLDVRSAVDWDHFYEEWCQMEIADRVALLGYVELDDLSLAVVDDVPEEVIEAQITKQIESLLN